MQVQHQSEFEKDRIKSVGISIADGKFGPFELLIDEINVLSGDDYWECMNGARQRRSDLALDPSLTKKLL